MIYTTRFGDKIPEAHVAIAIVNQPPSDFTGIIYKALAPTYNMIVKLAQTHNNEVFIKQYYKEVLNKLDPEVVIKELHELSGGKDIALLSHEINPPPMSPYEFILKSQKYFSHRHLVTRWLKDHGYYSYVCDLWING